MTLGLCGSHRSGKSTLAEAYAEAQGITYIPSRAGAVFQAMGFQVGQPLTAEQRMDVQEAVLDAHVADLKAARGEWITDRSPLDMAAYTLSGLTDGNGDIAQRALGYVDRCFWECSRHFAMVVLVQPGIAYVEAAGKPPASLVGQELINTLLWGLTQDPRLQSRAAYIARDCLDLAERVAALGHIQRKFHRLAARDLERMGYDGGIH